MYNFDINVLKNIILNKYNIDIILLMVNLETNKYIIDVLYDGECYIDINNNKYNKINNKIGKKIT